jgi:hypothetical protein
MTAKFTLSVVANVVLLGVICVLLLGRDGDGDADADFPAGAAGAIESSSSLQSSDSRARAEGAGGVGGGGESAGDSASCKTQTASDRYPHEDDTLKFTLQRNEQDALTATRLGAHSYQLPFHRLDIYNCDRNVTYGDSKYKTCACHHQQSEQACTDSFEKSHAGMGALIEAVKLLSPGRAKSQWLARLRRSMMAMLLLRRRLLLPACCCCCCCGGGGGGGGGGGDDRFGAGGGGRSGGGRVGDDSDAATNDRIKHVLLVVVVLLHWWTPGHCHRVRRAVLCSSAAASMIRQYTLARSLARRLLPRRYI